MRNGGEAFCIDSPVFPDELEILPAIAEQSGFDDRRRARDARRLGPPARRPRVPGGAAGRGREHGRAADQRAGRGAARAARLRRRVLRDAAEAAVVAGRAAARRAGATSTSGRETLELHPADGHTADGMAVWVPWARVLVAGDYLSPVEIPMLCRGGRRRRTWRRLNRLEPLVEQADHVVPGHGGADRRDARAGDPARGPRLPRGAAARRGRRAAARPPDQGPARDPREEPHAAMSSTGSVASRRPRRSAARRPEVDVSPSRRTARSTRTPLCQVPLRLPSSSRYGLAVLADDQRVPARDASASSISTSALRLRPRRVTVPMIGTSVSIRRRGSGRRRVRRRRPSGVWSVG